MTYPPPPGQVTTVTNVTAYVALALGVASMACLYPLAVPAVLVGVNALRRSRQLGGAGRGPAIGGIVTGAIGTVIGVTLFLVLFVITP